MKIVFSAFLLLFSLNNTEAKMPRVDTEAATGCHDCGDSNSGLPLINVKAEKGKATFPLPKCMGIRSDSGGSGLWLARRAGGRYKHTGVDWYAPVGTPLMSPWGGRVIQSSYSKKAGHTIKIKHDNGYETVYMHLDKRQVKLGAKLKAGQTIGTVGKSGNAKGKSIKPHVHFELKRNGKRINPGKVFGCSKVRK